MWKLCQDFDYILVIFKIKLRSKTGIVLKINDHSLNIETHINTKKSLPEATVNKLEFLHFYKNC